MKFKLFDLPDFKFLPNPPSPPLWSITTKPDDTFEDEMCEGMVFDLYRKNEPTIRVMAINNSDVINLHTFEIIRDVEITEGNVSNILIDNIFKL